MSQRDQSHAGHQDLLTEARLLLDAAEVKLTSLLAEGSAVADNHTEAPCVSCPLCRLLAIMRGQRPEVTARFAEGAIAVIGSLRLLLGSATNTAEPAPERAEPEVQHIRLDD